MSDEANSVTHVTDENSVLNKYEYDAFGNTTSCEEKVHNLFQYRGQQLDSMGLESQKQLPGPTSSSGVEPRAHVPSSEGGSNTTKLYLSAGDNVVDLIVENGFRTDLPNPKAAFNNNRYGRGVYLADSPATALAERGGGIILEVDANIGKSLNVTNRGILDYDMGHAIARGARKHGYDSIVFNSAQRSGGINTTILDPNNIKGVTK